MTWQVLIKAPLAGAFFVAWSLAAAQVPSVRTAEVARVIDGDSLQLASGQQVRLIGVNTPEMVGANDQPEALAETARDTVRRMIAGRPVRIIAGHEKRDRHRRWLAYVETADGRDIQERLLTEGLGFLVAIPPNLARLNRYQFAQQQARSVRRGVWALSEFAPLDGNQLDKTSGVRGFKQVRGRITRYNASRSYYYFKMSNGFEIKIPRANWVYFDTAPKALVGKTLTARGWVTRGKYRLQMRVSHPAMIDFQ